MGSLRQILFIATLICLTAGGYAYYQQFVPVPTGTAEQPTQKAVRSVTVEVFPAQARKLTKTQEAVGTTRALRSIDIVPHAEGRIVDINIQAGQEVKAGTVLARLDDEIEQATLSETRAMLEEKTGALARSETLFRSKTVSRAAFDQVRSETAIAQAAKDRAQRQLDDRVVRAPFTGVLGISSTDLGARVDSDSVLTSLDDLSAVEIEFRLPETLYGQIKEGQSITASAAAFPGREFVGQVIAVDSRIDQTSRAFKVRALLPNDHRELPAGMFMRLSLAMGEREAVVVTEEAILVQGSNAFLFVVENGKAKQRRVSIGTRRDAMVEVLSGVTAGEAVISRGLQSLRDGSRVEVLNAPPATPDIQKSPPADAVKMPAARPSATEQQRS